MSGQAKVQDSERRVLDVLARLVAAVTPFVDDLDVDRLVRGSDLWVLNQAQEAACDLLFRMENPGVLCLCKTQGHAGCKEGGCWGESMGLQAGETP